MKRMYFKLSMMVTVVIVMLVACQEDLAQPDDDSMNIEEARSWFEANNSPIIVMNPSESGRTKPKKNEKPIALQNDWKHAFKSKNDKVEVVEVAIKTNGRFGFASQNSKKKWKETGNRGYLTSLSRLVVIKHKKNKQIESYIMTMMGEANYLEKKNFQLWDNTYLKKDKDFAGMVFFHTLEGKFVNGFQMEKGKVTGKIKKKVSGEDLSLSFGRTATTTCTTYYVYTYYEQCTDWYTSGENYIDTTCEYSSQWTDSYEVCESTEEPDNLGNSGGGPGPDPSLDTSPDPEPDPEPDPCKTTKEDLKKVFPSATNTNLTTIKDAINAHGKDFGIDSKEKLRHFLAQAGHETTGFTDFDENLGYRVSKLNETWGKRFNPEGNPTKDPTKKNPYDYANSKGTYVDKEKLANYVYGGRMGNNTTGDGYKYRGRGIFQLTGKDNYEEFNTFYQANYDSNVDLVANPGLIVSDLEIGTISALWFFKNKVIDKISNMATTTVEKVTENVNGGDNGIADRKTKYNSTKTNIDCVD